MFEEYVDVFYLRHLLITCFYHFREAITFFFKNKSTLKGFKESCFLHFVWFCARCLFCFNSFCFFNVIKKIENLRFSRECFCVTGYCDSLTK
eukprot:UN25004